MQLEDLGDEGLILIAPIQNDLELVHQSYLPSLHFRINRRTCLAG